MSDEDLVEKSAANDDHINKLVVLDDEQPYSVKSVILEHITFTEESESSLKTNSNANDGLDEELWTPFC